MELRQLFLLWYTWVQLTSLIPIHSQINPVQILQIAFDFHFNIIILNIYSCPKRLLFWGIPAYKIFYFFFLQTFISVVSHLSEFFLGASCVSGTDMISKSPLSNTLSPCSNLMQISGYSLFGYCEPSVKID